MKTVTVSAPGGDVAIAQDRPFVLIRTTVTHHHMYHEFTDKPIL